MIPSPNNNKEWEDYIYKKSIATYDDICDDMGVGDCVDENGCSIGSEDWYWNGASEEMNEDIS